MPDPILARNTLSFTPVPEGDYRAVCVDVIDLGYHLNEKWAQIQPKCALVFQLDETKPGGDRYEISERFTVSMGAKSRLRDFLEKWRGRPYKPDQLEDGVPLDKLAGQCAEVTVVHNHVGDKIYANLFSIRPYPKGGPRLEAQHYTRSSYWLSVLDRAVPQPGVNGAMQGAGQEPDDSDIPF